MQNTSILSPESLAAMDADNLRILASKLGVAVHHKAGAEKIRGIIAASQQITNPDAGEAVIPVVKPAKPNATVEEIRAEAQKYAGKGFEIRFIDDDNTWHVRCKGAEDTGTVHQPINAIAGKFATVARGALLPRGIKVDGKVMFT